MVLILVGLITYGIYIETSSYYHETTTIEFTLQGNTDTYILQIPIITDDNGPTNSMEHLNLHSKEPPSASFHYSFKSNDNYTFIEITSSANHFTLEGSYNPPRKSSSQVAYEPYLFTHTIYTVSVNNTEAVPIIFLASSNVTGWISYIFKAETNLCGTHGYPVILSDDYIAPGLNFVHHSALFSYACA